jgi:hypothetical protein
MGVPGPDRRRGYKPQKGEPLPSSSYGHTYAYIQGNVGAVDSTYRPLLNDLCIIMGQWIKTTLCE